MTRFRLMVVLVCLLLTSVTSAQFTQPPDPGTGGSRNCTYWMCPFIYGQTYCWPQGDPTGIRALKCSVTCDSGECWCDYQNYCYSI